MGSKHFKKTGDFMLFRADAAIRCPACRHLRTMSGRNFAALFSRNMLLVSAIKRLRCAECGHKGAEIAAVPPQE
jgi:DNA-directed RNA polymerase subunit RPC12/RpoP